MEINEAIKTISENMDSEQVKMFLQPITDRAVSKGIESFKTNHLPEMIRQATAEPESPAEIELKKLQADLEKMRSDKERAEIESQMIEFAAQNGLPASIGKALTIHSDIETSRVNITALAGQIKSTLDYEKIKNANGSIPIKGDSISSTFNLETIGNMSTDDIYKNLNNLTKGN